MWRVQYRLGAREISKDAQLRVEVFNAVMQHGLAFTFDNTRCTAENQKGNLLGPRVRRSIRNFKPTGTVGYCNNPEPTNAGVGIGCETRPLFIGSNQYLKAPRGKFTKESYCVITHNPKSVINTKFMKPADQVVGDCGFFHRGVYGTFPCFSTGIANYRSLRKTHPVPILIGMIAGLISGSFGVGGGIIIVPGLVVFLHFTQRISHGTSLMAIIPIVATGAISFLFHDSVDLAYALFLGLGSILGAIMGTKLLGSLSNIWLARIFSALLLITAVRLFIDIPIESKELELSPAIVIVLILIGVLIGAIAGLLGVGGGLFLVPILIIFFGATAPVAKGTSLLVGLIAGTTGTWRNYRNANVDIPVAIKIGLAGIPAALIGAQLAMIMPDRVSAILFAFLLLASAASLLRSAHK